INAAGGVYGRKITYSWADDGSNLSTNLAGARKLVEVDNDFAIVELTTVAKGSASYLHSRRVPVTGVALEPVWSQDDNMFTFINFLGPGSVSTWGDYTASQGGRNALILWTTFNGGTHSQVTKMAASLRAAGVHVADALEVSPQGTAANPASLG